MKLIRIINLMFITIKVKFEGEINGRSKGNPTKI